MFLSSGDVALSLLSSQGLSASQSAAAATTAKPTATTPVTGDSSGVTYVPSGDAQEDTQAVIEMMKMVGARVELARGASEQLRNGSASPFDAELGQTAGIGEARFRLFETDPRMEFEGAFAITFVDTGMGATQTQRDADFPARSDAMAYAYHFATALAQDAQQAVTDMAWIDANSDTTRDASGRIYGTNADGTFKGDPDEAFTRGTFDALTNFRSMERNAASLANLFSLDAASLTNAAYDGSFQGFSISHGTLGKIMDVAANGSVTLYDAEGKGYSAAEYSAANIDGGIPQLRNDLRRQADSQKSSI